MPRATLPETLFTTTDAIDDPALSPDGDRVAFQRMEREDWEIWILDAPVGTAAGEEGAAGPRRLTHDIQHDVLPTWA